MIVLNDLIAGYNALSELNAKYILWEREFLLSYSQMQVYQNKGK